MPSAIDSLSGEQFYAFTQGLRWGGGTSQERRCKGDPACDGMRPTKRTNVRVDAVVGQDSLSATSLPPTGIVAVRALNRGSYEEARYGMRAGKNLSFYLIVLPRDARGGTWRLEELTDTPGARTHRRIATGTFSGCNHPYKPGRANQASFHRCDDGHMSDTVQRSSLMLQVAVEPPFWVGCAQGCCVAEML